jgi:hypothetical protein
VRAGAAVKTASGVSTGVSRAALMSYMHYMPDVCRRTALRWGVAALLPLTAGLFCVREPAGPAAQDPQTWKMPVAGVTADYIKETDKVLVRWERPSEFDYDVFTLYRAPLFAGVADTLDTALLNAAGIWKVLGKNDSAYTDTPGVSNIVFVYAIRAARYSDAQTRDLVEGVFSEWCYDTVLVGADVSFNINGGDIYVVTPGCSVFVNDYALRLKSVRFTQKIATWLVNTSNQTRLKMSGFDDPLNLPDNERLKALVKEGWLKETSELGANVVLDSVPIFDSLDARNPLLAGPQILDGMVNAFPWNLEMGNGRKRVYAEITFKDPALPADTLEDYIDIRPYRITMKMQNKTGASDETMRRIESETFKGRLGSGDNFYIVYARHVDFSVSIYADTSVADTFHYWLLTSDSTCVIDFNIVNEKVSWLETTPLRGGLTGGGGFFHDDNHVYRYQFDPSMPGNDVAALRRTSTKPGTSSYKSKVPGFKFTGSELFNETCVPGSYWGENPLWWNAGDSALQPAQAFIDKPSASLDSQFVSLAQDELYGKGKKEFAIVARFTGKYFGDTRTIVSNKKEDGEYGMRTYFDLYPPEINMTAKDDNGPSHDYFTIGSYIIGPFNYALDKRNSVIDQGFSEVEDVYLIIAQKPPDFEWNDRMCTTLPLDTLFKMRYQIFRYDIKVRTFVLQKVRWDNIDPTEWPSGQYLMGIVAEDEFGNAGFGISNEQFVDGRPAFPNPWIVTVLTGR